MSDDGCAGGAPSEDTVEARVVVPLTPADAFDLFALRLGEWWPRAYTWSGDVLEAIGLEPHEGGLCWELGPHDFRCDWGRVLAWEPPHRLAFTWQIGPTRAPQPDPARASEVEVGFAPLGEGTEVRVVHRGFSRHGEGADQYLAAMGSPQGWAYMLDEYRARAG